MRAGRLTTLWIVLRSAFATLRISVATLYEAYRGTHRRSSADARLAWWSRRLLDLAGLECRVVNPEGVELPRGRPTIIMSNHSSLYDIPLVFAALDGSIRMLTKKELFRVPVWGRAMRAAEFISIDRRHRAQALRDLDVAREKMQGGIVLWVAPEGTRSRDGSLGAFKKGGFMLALQTGAVIVPVAIRGAHEVLPPGSLRMALGRTAEVRVGRAIDASGYSIETRDALMAEVERSLRALAEA